MVFSSTTFLIIFLPVTMVLYYLLGVTITKSTAVKNLILLIASLIFYAWGEPVYIILMLISICFNFFVGKDMDQAKQMNRKKKVRTLFISAVIFNIGVLGFFKYSNFLIENIANITGLGIRPLNLPLPVGISFYTFQILSYIIDLYNGNIRAQRRFLSFALYVSLFPQLIAGPIVKYKDISDQLMYRKEDLSSFSKGLNRFVFGLSKKLILANTLGSVYSFVQDAGTDNISMLTAWVGIICYTLQIYFDFSGYSDMAIGLGGIFGFSFCENFNYPYIAVSVTDFWRRWHMSLSSWFRDYVYIPLGGNRCKVPRVILNLLIVWMLTGFWHGASWNFLLWGLFYGILLILEKYVLAGVINKIPKGLRWFITMICVMVGWVLFSAPSLGEALNYIGAMFGYAISFVDSFGAFILFTNLVLIIIAAICATPIYTALSVRLGEKRFSKLMVVVTPVLFLLCVIFMISETYNPFLYFRF
ncbi:MAG: MBOAT family protein [Clostridiales bacterium]|nr:MBOAT family protein [Clostridiales bacterium]